MRKKGELTMSDQTCARSCGSVRPRGTAITCIGLVFGVLALLLVSCASSAGAVSESTSDQFLGIGKSSSFGQAINNAKIDAIRKAVISIVGAATEQAEQRRLEQVLYKTMNPNAFVYLDSMQTLRKDNTGTIDAPNFVYEIRIRVNIEAVQSVLDAEGISRGAGSQADAGATNPPQTNDSSPATGSAPVAVLTPQQGDFVPPTDAEQRFIRQYVDSMTYMVYFDEKSNTSPFLMKEAVAQADGYLASNGMTAVDEAQIESLKKDQTMVYEQETGRNVGIIQWIAQKLNADVYIEIDAETSGDTQGNLHYGSANITLKLFETSTGQLLGSVPFRSQRTVSTSSVRDAEANAIQSAVWSAMPPAVEQARQQLARAFSRGLRFDLTLQDTPDARVVSDFRRQLRSRVADVQTLSQSSGSTQFIIHYYGRVDALADLVFSIAGQTPGLERMSQVLIRGKSLVFNTGIER